MVKPEKEEWLERDIDINIYPPDEYYAKDVEDEIARIQGLIDDMDGSERRGLVALTTRKPDSNLEDYFVRTKAMLAIYRSYGLLDQYYEN